MDIYVLLHFELKNDAAIIIEPHRANHLWLVVLYKGLTLMVTSF